MGWKKKKEAGKAALSCRFDVYIGSANLTLWSAGLGFNTPSQLIHTLTKPNPEFLYPIQPYQTLPNLTIFDKRCLKLLCLLASLAQWAMGNAHMYW